MVYVPIIIHTDGTISGAIGSLLGIVLAFGIILTVYGIHFSRPLMKGEKWCWDVKTITIGVILNLVGIGIMVFLLTNI